MNDNFDDILAKWIAGELSPEELADFEQREDFALYNQIAEESKHLQSPNFDKAQQFEALWQQIEQEQQQTKPINKRGKIRRLLPMGIAAAIALLVTTVFLFNNRTVSHTAGNQSQRNITLPDGSIVLLSSNSSIQYKPGKFKKQRDITLIGQAFFEVEEGKPFTVMAYNGTVRVLGTSFNVFSHKDVFETICFSGKVEVTHTNGAQAILTKGMGTQSSGNEINNFSTETTEQPDWKTGEFHYENESLNEVFIELEQHYGVSITYSSSVGEMRFTGYASTQNIENAMRSIALPMQLQWVKNGDNILVE